MTLAELMMVGPGSGYATVTNVLPLQSFHVYGNINDM